MARKYAALKEQLLLQYSEGLKQFRPWETDSFLCPVCLKAISASKKEEISIAHIIPNASAGKPVTLVCRECNSFFGANQDRWFGDYRRMRGAGGTIFDLPTPARVTGLNDTSAAGWIQRRSKDGPVEVHVLDQTVPEDFDWKSIQKVSITHQFYNKNHVVNLGALTAAFLAYFSVFGYSWAMSWAAQAVRDQIRRPSEQIVTGFCICVPSHAGNTLGVATLGDEILCPYAAFDDRFVLLPPVDWEGFYEKAHSVLSSPTTLKWRPFGPLPEELRMVVSFLMVDGKLLLGRSDVPRPGQLCVYSPSFDTPVQVRRTIDHRGAAAGSYQEIQFS
ncbi:MAG: HNH endonuclease [Gammaproteobacteria bacterium]|nr:MAG: HNH endonuclease [Gammaproteobacteria bacterium]